MKRNGIAGLIVSSALLLGVEAAVAEQKSAAEQLAGTWSLVSLVAVQGDNSFDVFGAEPRGKMILTPGGHFSTLTTRASLHQFASNNRMQGTPEEYAAIVHGANAHYGTYAVDEENGKIVFRVEVSTFPNWEGQEHERIYTLEGDELSYVNPTSAIGASSARVVSRT